MPKLESVWDGSTGEPRRITTVSEYSGEASIAVAATQLGTNFTPTEGARIVREWVAFFSAGPTAITELRFLTRTPKRLFNALAGQTQLQRLFVKWGDYEDLGVLQGIKELRALRLGGASKVADISPLASLTELANLEIESLRMAHDLSALGGLTQLTQLELGGDWRSLRTAHIDSIAWLPNLRNLEHLLLHTVIVDDLDYTPLLLLPRLKAVRVKKARGMRPSHSELVQRLPWAA
jgi:hypothetical protein